MIRKTLIFIAYILALTAPAHADWVTVQCDFATECYETEACDGSALSFRLSAGESAGEVLMRSPGETVSGRVGGSDATSLIWKAETESAAHLLSWGADGSARYSVHLLLGPEVVTYHGQCETKN